jgi:periplasmic divalent cation tolerance protein
MYGRLARTSLSNTGEVLADRGGGDSIADARTYHARMDSSKEDARLVLSTVPDRGVAERIARDLVGRRLAACVSLLPSVRSVYRWKGTVEEADEVLLVVKTTAARIPELERRLAEIHPYELPEFVALAPQHVEAKYLAWLADETRRAGSGPA